MAKPRYSVPRVYYKPEAYEWIKRKLATGEKPWRGCGPLWFREMVHEQPELAFGKSGKRVHPRAFRQAITVAQARMNGSPSVVEVPSERSSSEATKKARSLATVLISRIVGMAQNPGKTSTLEALEELTRSDE